MLKKVLLLIFVAVQVQASYLQLSNDGYKLNRRGRKIEVASHDVDPLLRKMNPVQLVAFQAKYKVKAKKLSDGSYRVLPNMKLKGGGPAGATVGCWIGRFVAQAIGYGVVAPIMALPALALGPVAYGVAVAGAAGTIAPIVETTSTATAVAGGIIGGVITGPA